MEITLALSFLLVFSVTGSVQQRPNIIFILADDLVSLNTGYLWRHTNKITCYNIYMIWINKICPVIVLKIEPSSWSSVPLKIYF